MKKIIYPFLALLLFTSCTNRKNSNNQLASLDKAVSAIEIIVDSIITSNSDSLYNEANWNQTALTIQTTVLNAVEMNSKNLTDVPVLFEGIIKNGTSHIAKFSYTVISSNSNSKNKYEIYFPLLAELSEKKAKKLVEDSKYHLSFKSIKLASGNLLLLSNEEIKIEPSILPCEIIDSVDPVTETYIFIAPYLLTEVEFKLE